MLGVDSMNLLSSLFSLVLLLFNPVILILAVIVVILLILKNKKHKEHEYKESAYYQVTNHPYLSVRNNIGRYGEYLTYKDLKHMETDGAKFLFNVYIPKENGDTTEIDVLMICPKGIFVFESKNYSGWIFGNESQKNWYQTLPARKGRSHKEHFYNPVMQNRSHIKHLKTFLGEQVPIHSIIVFSDRCTLKNIQIQSNDISVINRYNVASVVSAICNQTPTDLLTGNNIGEIYSKLYPFTQVDEIAKAQHIANIQNNMNGRPVQQVQPIQTKPVVQKVATPEPAITTQTAVVSANSVMVNETEHTVQTAEPMPIETARQFPKCPRCNGNLVLRTATRGANAGNQFYGCSNYPKCKYTQNLTNNKTV